jgi:hypothetical protein
MGTHAANTLLVGDVLTEDGGTVELVRAAVLEALEPAGTTVLSVSDATHWYKALYPNAQLVSLSNR